MILRLGPQTGVDLDEFIIVLCLLQPTISSVLKKKKFVVVRKHVLIPTADG